MRFRLWHIVDIVWLKWWFLWAKSVITFWSVYSCCKVQQEEVGTTEQNDGTHLNIVLDAMLTCKRQTGWHWLALVVMHSSDKQSFFHTEDIKNVKKKSIYIIIIIYKYNIYTWCSGCMGVGNLVPLNYWSEAGGHLQVRNESWLQPCRPSSWNDIDFKVLILPCRSDPCNRSKVQSLSVFSSR